MGSGALRGGSRLGGLCLACSARELGANEVIVTIMMNFLALILATYFITGPWASGATPVTKSIVEAGYLPILLPGTRLHANLLVALAATALIAVMLNRSVLGYRGSGPSGSNPRAAAPSPASASTASS